MTVNSDRDISMGITKFGVLLHYIKLYVITIYLLFLTSTECLRNIELQL